MTIKRNYRKPECDSVAFRHKSALCQMSAGTEPTEDIEL